MDKRSYEMKNVTRKELAAAVNDQLGVSHRNSAEIVDTVFSVLKDTLENGESIKLVQFGTLTVRDKSPRRGRNPRTGEPMTISKRKMVSFRPSKQFRERLNK
jgi:integration host factor subunit alpha